mgnify:CR=1 FL=1
MQEWIQTAGRWNDFQAKWVAVRWQIIKDICDDIRWCQEARIQEQEATR